MSSVVDGRKYLFTSESVSEGHPDKLCDQVSDAILDACLAVDPDAKVACETCTKTGFVMVFGEISLRKGAVVDYEKIVRETVKSIGYDDEAKGLDYRTMRVNVELEEQSCDIAGAVHVNKTIEEIGAGDQGHVFGYACDETPECMPLSHSLASRLAARLSECRREGILAWSRPDAKTQVTVEYVDEKETGRVKPLRVHTVLISAQHDTSVDGERISKDLMQHVVLDVIPSKWLDSETRYIFNPSGKFLVGGPQGDAGLTGRKIIVDTYGGWGSHGGGAFSGKDATKVDRSGAYMARWAAKSLVANGLCSRAVVQVSYAIGVPRPLSMYVNSFGTVRKGFSDQQLEQIVSRNFDFRPGCIRRDLGLTRPQFARTAVYGHFGREGFTWEQSKDLSHELALAVNNRDQSS